MSRVTRALFPDCSPDFTLIEVFPARRAGRKHKNGLQPFTFGGCHEKIAITLRPAIGVPRTVLVVWVCNALRGGALAECLRWGEPTPASMTGRHIQHVLRFATLAGLALVRDAGYSVSVLAFSSAIASWAAFCSASFFELPHAGLKARSFTLATISKALKWSGPSWRTTW